MPERIRANNAEISPEEISLAQPESTNYVDTLQHWLSLIRPRLYNVPCTGNFDQETQLAFHQFITENNLLSGTSIGIDTWNALEKNLTEAYRVDPEAKRIVSFGRISEPAGAVSALKSLGIDAGPDENEMSRGWRLYHALQRKINKFEHLSLFGEKISRFPDLVTGAAPASKYLFDNFKDHWTTFYGSPWLGVITRVPPSMDVADALWCSARLYRFLRKLGQAYVSVCLDKGLVLEEVLANPLIVLYTGKKFGGLIADRNDFSQIGMSAAIELTAFHISNITLISDALLKADPSYRLRLGKNESIPSLPNVEAKEEFNITPVLEPEFENLFYQPSRIRKKLLQKPDFFDRVPVSRLAEGISENAPFISADEYAVLLKELKHTTFDVELGFIASMNEYGGLGYMFKKFTEEERSFIEAMLAIDIRSFALIGGGAVNTFYDNLVNFESKLVEIVNAKDSLGDTIIQTGLDAARKEIGDFVKGVLIEKLKEYAKQKLS